MQPIDASAAQNAILYPGYNQKVKQYELQRQDALTQATFNKEAAQAEAERARGGYYTSRSEQERNRFKLDPKSGMMFDTYSGQIVQAPKTLPGKIQELVDAGFSNDDAHRIAVGEKPDQTFEITPEAGKRIGLAPDANGKYRIPASSLGSIYRTDNPVQPVQKPQVTPEMRAAATAVGADPNDPDSWTAQQAGSILDRVKPLRAEREPSAADQRYQDQTKIRQLANRVISDAKNGGSTDATLYDDAIRNARTFYQNDPDIDTYREDVISRIQSLKRGGLNTDVVQNRANRGAGNADWAARLQGAKSQASTTSYATQPSGRPAAPVMQANSLQDVIAKAPAGVHKLRNGSVLEKRADGTVFLDGKAVR